MGTWEVRWPIYILCRPPPIDKCRDGIVGIDGPMWGRLVFSLAEGVDDLASLPGWPYGNALWKHNVTLSSFDPVGPLMAVIPRRQVAARKFHGGGLR